MKLFCREDHNPIKEEPDYEKEFLEAQARLAELELLPASMFSDRTRTANNFVNGQILKFAVDNKADAIANTKAKIARLKVLTQKDKGADND